MVVLRKSGKSERADGTVTPHKRGKEKVERKIEDKRGEEKGGERYERINSDSLGNVQS